MLLNFGVQAEIDRNSRLGNEKREACFETTMWYKSLKYKYWWNNICIH